MRCTPGGFFYSCPAIFEVPLYLIIDRTSRFLCYIGKSIQILGESKRRRQVSYICLTRIILRPLSALSLDIAKRNITTELFGLTYAKKIYHTSFSYSLPFHERHLLLTIPRGSSFSAKVMANSM